MRKFMDKDNRGWQFGEKQVVELGTNKVYVLTQAKDLFSEDYYHVRRGIACQSVPADVAAEPDFYVYEIAYMSDGCSLCIQIVDEETAEKLLKDSIIEFMRGSAIENIKKCFEKVVQA